MAIDVREYLKGFVPGTAHEAVPHGVPSGYSWANYAVGSARSLTAPTNYVNWWGQVYVDITNNHANNVRVQINNVKLLIKYADESTWRLIQDDGSGIHFSGYPEDFVGSGSPSNTSSRTESTGGYSCVPYNGYNSHFWPNEGNIEIPRTGIVIHTIVLADIRAIKDNSSGADNIDSNNYIIGFGVDYKGCINNGVLDRYCCVGVCKAFGDGKFIKVTRNWRKSVMTTLTLSDLNSGIPLPAASYFDTPGGGTTCSNVYISMNI